MLILGISPSEHDACACLFDEYRLVSAVALERLTRRKVDGGRIPVEAVEECLNIAQRNRREVDAVMLGRGSYPARYFTHLTGGRLLEARVRQALGKHKPKSMEAECIRYKRSDSAAMFDRTAFLHDHGFRPNTTLGFFNHHLAHALPALFHTDWPEALLYTADGGGDNICYSAHALRGGHLDTLFGEESRLLAASRVDSVGLAYAFATKALGFQVNRHEGKLTGLAAYGKPVLYPALAARFRVEEDGQIISDFANNRAMCQFIVEGARGRAREDVASSVQLLLENLVLKALRRILDRHPSRHLGVAGGVFANVRLNQRIAEELPVEEVFVYPAMSDSGLACGGVLQFLLDRDGLDRWLAERYRLDTLYYGQDFGSAMDRRFADDTAFRTVSTTPVETAAELLEQRNVVAIYTKGGEYGPRALGARSILAAPIDHQINQVLNQRLARSEFMPFAPVVLAEDAQKVFDLGAATLYAARFMTLTCRVRDEWRERIPAVVHVDGTARPQVVHRAQNPLYYDILAAYKGRTGIPVLVNTSFNVHEEPIINTPEECARALTDGRVDCVVTENAIYAQASRLG
jgi:carbamoyltransferase